MTFLLDTNVIAGLRRPGREPRLDAWLRPKPAELLHISVLTVGEIEKGIERQRRTDPSYAERLTHWLDQMKSRFEGRILPVDMAVAGRWGPLAHRQPDDEIDMLIAATALEHGLVLATRNLADFRGIPELWLENPFT